MSLVEPLARLIESATPAIESATPTYDQLGTVVVRSGSRFDASAPRNCHRSKDGAMARAVLGRTAHGAARPQRRRTPRPRLRRESTTRPNPRDLSEGQKRVLVLAILAIQLSAAPRALLLDEPTRGLDYRAKTELVRSVDALAAQGRTVVISTHDVEFAARAADRVVVMAEGEVVVDGPTFEVIVTDGPTSEVIVASPVFAPADREDPRTPALPHGRPGGRGPRSGRP